MKLLLIGVEDTQVDGALQLITTSCRPHAELEPSKTGLTMRRALVFILGVESCVGVMRASCLPGVRGTCRCTELPAISTGIFGYLMEEAAQMMLRTAQQPAS